MRSKKTGRVPAWALALLYLALAVAALALFHSYTVTDEDQLFLTPIFTDAKGWDIYRLDGAGGRVALTPKEAAEATGTVYLSRVLDPAYETAGYTTLELDGPVSVFLDGALLYTTAPGSGDKAEGVELPAGYEVPAAGEIPRLTLPPGYGGKMLTLAFERGADSYGTPGVILSSRAAETALAAAQANGLGMPAAAYMTAAFLLLGLLLYGGFQGKWDGPMLLMTLAAALQAFYQLREYDMRFVYRSALDMRLAALIPPLFVALPLAYLLCRMERAHRRRRAAVILIPAAVALLPPLFYVLGLSLLAPFYELCTQALYLSIAAVLACAVLEARRGSRAFRLFFMGLGALIASLAVTCLFSGGLAAQVGAVLKQAIHGLPALPLYWSGAALFVLCAGMSVGDAIRRMAENQSKADMLAMQVSALRRQAAAIHAGETRLATIRHDTRFYMQNIGALLQDGKPEEALRFVQQYDESILATRRRRWCENTTLDAILSLYLEQAEQEGVAVSARLDIPEDLPVDIVELSTVFANAIENALTACRRQPEGAARRIELNAVTEPQFAVEIANTFSGQVRFGRDGLPVTDQPGHGFGTRSIAAYARKHGASLHYKAKDGMFRLYLLAGADLPAGKTAEL
ncbi:GHKL domain-containing protein [Intestinibacillus massiliensis]|nr:GHKL domain-containing protein [Intestinibacillus massiliensis]